MATSPEGRTTPGAAPGRPPAAVPDPACMAPLATPPPALVDGQRAHLGAAASWLAGQATRTAVNIAGCAALAAAAAAIIRLRSRPPEPHGHAWLPARADRGSHSRSRSAPPTSRQPETPPGKPRPSAPGTPPPARRAAATHGRRPVTNPRRDRLSASSWSESAAVSRSFALGAPRRCPGAQRAREPSEPYHQS